MFKQMNLDHIVNVGGLLIFSLWLLKRIADMDRYHVLRVVIISSVLSLLAGALILTYFMPQQGPCVLEMEQDSSFVINE